MKYILTPFLLALILLLARESCHIFQAIFHPRPPMTMMGNLEMYEWTAVGIVAYLLLKGLLRKNLEWMETFSHELTHTIVSMLTLRKVHLFQAGEKTGAVTTSGGGFSEVLVSLAPYCLPIFTYLLLFLRPLVATDGMWIFDILLGLTIAFHTVCFSTQTGNHQTDINKYPLAFSYAYIYAALLFNINTILVSYWTTKNVFTAWKYCIFGIFDF